MDKILVICGPTATGKTGLGLSLAERFHGEIISADSRQVYKGMDIVTGKDIPAGFSLRSSSLNWQGKPLTYYSADSTRIWLTDIVNPDEPFNVSFWRDIAGQVIADILARDRLPIVVGGTGLFIRSLIQNLPNISIPPDPVLRLRVAGWSQARLFDYLNQVDPLRAAGLNISDRANPRRLIRALEITLASPIAPSTPPPAHEFLQLGLTAPRSELYSRIDQRIISRLSQGAAAEAACLLSRYPSGLSAFSACGYRSLLLADPLPSWRKSEHAYVRRQLTWFKKIPGIHWIDVSQPDWQPHTEELVENWYN
jgi:tRNA dimethylallyltransferase